MFKQYLQRCVQTKNLGIFIRLCILLGFNSIEISFLYESIRMYQSKPAINALSGAKRSLNDVNDDLQNDTQKSKRRRKIERLPENNVGFADFDKSAPSAKRNKKKMRCTTKDLATKNHICRICGEELFSGPSLGGHMIKHRKRKIVTKLHQLSSKLFCLLT